MHTITFCSFKGGTAKTSTALHLAAALAKNYAKKVLLVDFDPQANLSTGMGLGPDQVDGVVGVLQGKQEVNEVIKETCVANLDIVCANTFLDGVEAQTPLVGDLYAHERLRKALSKVQDGYDFCFIDTPPSLGWLTQSAFFASDQSIICAIPEPYSVLALNRLRDYHEAINEHHPLSVMGVVITFWDERGATNKAYVDAVEEAFPDKLFTTRVRRNIAVSRAILEGRPVLETAPRCHASRDYRMLAQEFLLRYEHVNPLSKMEPATV